jgi:hypothetical protein
MGNWLSGRTTNLCAQMNTMALIFDDIKENFIKSNHTYYSTAQKLADPATFTGQGAQAFLTAIGSDINRLRPLVDSFGHLASGCATLSSSITSASTAHDGKIAAIRDDQNIRHDFFDKWREALISTFFTNADSCYMSDTLGQVLQNGSSFAVTPWSAAFDTVEAIAVKDAQQYAADFIDGNWRLQADQWIGDHVPWGMGQWVGVPTQQQIQAQENQIYLETQKTFVQAFSKLSTEIVSEIQAWADELQGDYKAFQAVIQNPNGYLSARDVYDLIYYGSRDGKYAEKTQDTNSPVTLTPYTTRDGKKGLLMTLGGTDPSHLTNDDSILAALDTGEGLSTAYLTIIHNALETYMSEHPAMVGAELTIAGYSLGGMQAQLLADNLVNGAYPDLIQQHNLHVAHVITYGAPVMGSPANGVDYTMYDTTDDPVPLLSYYENPHLLKLQGTLAKLNNSPIDAIKQLLSQVGDVGAAYLSLIHADQLPWQQKIDTYIDPRHQYHIISITDVGTTSLGTGDFHRLNFNNHLQYYRSDQLNSPTKDLDIDPSSLGPTEYFRLKE